MMLLNYLKRPSFNPLPARGPGDTRAHRAHTSVEFVSIRSRPGGREIRLKSLITDRKLTIVSIRSRPGGREIPPLVTSGALWAKVSIRSRPGGREILHLFNRWNKKRKSQGLREPIQTDPRIFR